MLDDGMRIELATRLRTMNRVLDCIVPDSPTEAVDEAIEIVLKAVGRQEMTQAVTILEEVVNTNPFWLRGYLLLATIYQYVQNPDQAIATTEKGLAACASSLACSVPLSGSKRWSGSTGLSYTVAFETMQNDSDDMNVYFDIGWRCFRSAAAISTKPLNSSPPSKRCLAPKEG